MYELRSEVNIRLCCFVLWGLKSKSEKEEWGERKGDREKREQNATTTKLSEMLACYRTRLVVLCCVELNEWMNKM